MFYYPLRFEIVVIYMDLVDEGDKAELVWPEFGKPYFQQISKAESGMKIARWSFPKNRSWWIPTMP